MMGRTINRGGGCWCTAVAAGGIVKRKFVTSGGFNFHSNMNLLSCFDICNYYVWITRGSLIHHHPHPFNLINNNCNLLRIIIPISELSNQTDA